MLWFAERRMKPDALDEDWGPMSRGTFAHSVLQHFYEEFIKQGNTKVTPENLPQARELLAQVFSQLQAQQPTPELQMSNELRYVPTNQLETQEVLQLERWLQDYLEFETEFLTGFRPRYFEAEIKPEDGIEYAGQLVAGTIDRVDVDEHGNAVIVDYKGSVKSEDSFNDLRKWPKKVQTLIYAQALQRMSDAGKLEQPLNVVGALYVSYGKEKGCAGSYDVRAIGAQDLPGISEKARCGDESPTFKEVLDVTERRLQPLLAALVAGELPTADELDHLKEQLIAQDELADQREVG